MVKAPDVFLSPELHILPLLNFPVWCLALRPEVCNGKILDEILLVLYHFMTIAGFSGY